MGSPFIIAQLFLNVSFFIKKRLPDIINAVIERAKKCVATLSTEPKDGTNNIPKSRTKYNKMFFIKKPLQWRG